MDGTARDNRVSSGEVTDSPPTSARTQPHPGREALWQRRDVRLASFIVFVGYLVVATFPGRFEAVGIGIDHSWSYAINRLPHTDLVFGRDVAFSYGPLGYLLYPRAIGSNLEQASVLWVIGQMMLAAVVVYHYRRHRNLAAVALFVLAYGLASAFILPIEYHLLTVVALLLTVSPKHNGAWRLAAPTAAVMTALLLFVKLTGGATASGMLVVAVVVWLVRRQVRVRQVLLSVALPYGLAIVVLGFATFDSPTSFFLWLRYSLEIASGYGAAMSLQKPPGLVYLGFLALGVFLLLIVLLVRGPGGSLTPLPLVPFALIGFRYSFVRHQGRFLYGILMAAIAVVLLEGKSKRRMLQAGAAFVVILGAALVAATFPQCECDMSARTFTGVHGWHHIQALLQLPETREELAARSQQILDKDRLPDDWAREIRSAEGGVDTVPYETVFVAANDLPWNPSPVLQTYSAYTETLDQWDAQHFSGGGAPAYILLQFVDIEDWRHPMLGAPVVWRSILAQYELARTESASGPYGQVFLLRHRAGPASMELQEAGREGGHIREWVEVPTGEGLMFGSLRFHYRPMGLVESLLWHIDPVFIDLEYAGGRTVTSRFLPGTSAGGLLMNLPASGPELAQLLDGEIPARVIRFRVRGPGVGSYEDSFDVTWQMADWRP